MAMVALSCSYMSSSMPSWCFLGVEKVGEGRRMWFDAHNHRNSQQITVSGGYIVNNKFMKVDGDFAPYVKKKDCCLWCPLAMIALQCSSEVTM